jgi:hypothetical protein
MQILTEFLRFSLASETESEWNMSEMQIHMKTLSVMDFMAGILYFRQSLSLLVYEKKVFFKFEGSKKISQTHIWKWVIDGNGEIHFRHRPWQII